MVLASQILNIEENRLNQHPDFFFLEREIDPKTGSFRKQISVSQARELKDKVSNVSWVGDKKVAVIDGAEYLSPSAANALLKILEEPTKGSYFFLLSLSEQLLLPTNRSRCQIFNFYPTSEEKIKQGLIAMGYEEKKAALCARLSLGKAGLAIDLVSDEEFFAEYEKEKLRWQEIVDSPISARLKKAQELAGPEAEDVDKKEMQRVLNFWEAQWHEVLSGNDKQDKKERAVVALTRIAQAKVLLDSNVNPRLVFENVVLNF